MTYFKNITTLEELRKEYKRLVKINHPDNGGSADNIKIINVEYEIKFKILEKSDTYNRKKYNRHNRLFRNGDLHAIYITSRDCIWF